MTTPDMHARRSFEDRLASSELLGDRPIDTSARVAALDCLVEDVGTSLTESEADMVIDYAARRFERGEVQGAIDTLLHMTGCDLTGAYRLASVLHTQGDANG